MAELRAFEPSWRDRLAGWMMGNERATPERRRMVEGLLGSSGLGNTGVGLVDVTPIGGLLGAQEAARDGDYRGAAMNAMFLGPAAKTANKVALKAAEEMAAKGASRDAIWNETGWFKGVDGKWRFEIPDNQAKIGTKAADDLFGMDGGKAATIESSAPGVLWHDDLYKAYPDLRNVQVKATRDESGGRGGYFSATAGKPEIGAQGENLGQLRSVMLHELQHGVQRAEGFARGGSPYDPRLTPMARELSQKAENDLDAIQSHLQSVQKAYAEKNNISPADQNYTLEMRRATREFMNNNPDFKRRYEQVFQDSQLKGPGSVYPRLSGEVEARNVQKRMDMTPEERQATPPWLTQDTPDELQIIRSLLAD